MPEITAPFSASWQSLAYFANRSPVLEDIVAKVQNCPVIIFSP
jgi:hypothetical protein